MAKRRGYTVVMYAKDERERENNIIFVEMLRRMLRIRKQIGREQIKTNIDKNGIDRPMSSWIKSSKATVVIFTPSFARNAWKTIFNKGQKTYAARTKVGKRFIPVVMPPANRSDLARKLGTYKLKAHTPVIFGLRWKTNLQQAAWVELANSIKCTGPINRSAEKINLIEFDQDMTYAIRNRKPTGKIILLGSCQPRSVAGFKRKQSVLLFN